MLLTVMTTKADNNLQVDNNCQPKQNTNLNSKSLSLSVLQCFEAVTQLVSITELDKMWCSSAQFPVPYSAGPGAGRDQILDTDTHSTGYIHRTRHNIVQWNVYCIVLKEISTILGETNETDKWPYLKHINFPETGLRPIVDSFIGIDHLDLWGCLST